MFELLNDVSLPDNRRKKKIRFCKGCKKELKGKRSYRSVFCTFKCHTDYKFDYNYTAWLNGEEKIWIDSKALKKGVIRKDGYICTECKITNWNSKPIVLELEHKDGNNLNNKPENLCLICPNCHSQTHTYKSKNKGNGRHSRRLRYKEGKSY